MRSAELSVISTNVAGSPAPRGGVQCFSGPAHRRERISQFEERRTMNPPLTALMSGKLGLDISFAIIVTVVLCLIFKKG
jgi:hypothetical protein